jgi:hypothetical protein
MAIFRIPKNHNDRQALSVPLGVRLDSEQALSVPLVVRLVRGQALFVILDVRLDHGQDFSVKVLSVVHPDEQRAHPWVPYGRTHEPVFYIYDFSKDLFL